MVSTQSSRRRVLVAGATAALAAVLPKFGYAASASDEPVKTRPIPHSGEQLPIVGIGTAVIFDFENDPAKQAERRKVLETLVAGGGKLIDTAHSYGRAEDRVGDIVAESGLRDRLFLATKYSSNASREAATASLQASLRRLKTNRIDLMQAWNVGDPDFDCGLMRDWQKQGVCRYIGMTTSFGGQYAAIGKVIRSATAKRIRCCYPPRAMRVPPYWSTCRLDATRCFAGPGRGRCRISRPSSARARGRSSFSNSYCRIRRSPRSSPAPISRATCSTTCKPGVVLCRMPRCAGG